MNRRTFLRALTLGVAGAAAGLSPLDYDPERLLWVPGAKTIFLPSAPPPVDPDWLVREFLRMMRHSLQVSKAINRSYEQQFSGLDVVTARIPFRLHVPNRG